MKTTFNYEAESLVYYVVYSNGCSKYLSNNDKFEYSMFDIKMFKNKEQAQQEVKEWNEFSKSFNCVVKQVKILDLGEV